jgi:anti-anti-sigma factor
MFMDGTYDRSAITLPDHLDGRCSAEVRTALHGAIEDHPERDLVVDVSKVEWIDLTALRMLAACALRLERSGRRLVLQGCTRDLRRLLAFTAWRPFFHVPR